MYVVPLAKVRLKSVLITKGYVRFVITCIFTEFINDTILLGLIYLKKKKRRETHQYDFPVIKFFFDVLRKHKMSCNSYFLSNLDRTRVCRIEMNICSIHVHEQMTLLQSMNIFWRRLFVCIEFRIFCTTANCKKTTTTTTTKKKKTLPYCFHYLIHL